MKQCVTTRPVRHSITVAVLLLATHAFAFSTTSQQQHYRTIQSSQLNMAGYTIPPDVSLKPAHGHAQPFWGKPDPYLSAGKSIAPKVDTPLLDVSNTDAATTAAADIPDKVQLAISKGWTVIDAQQIKGLDVMPGFSPTRGILPEHNPAIMPETPATFAAQVEWAAGFLDVVDKLPYVAIAYALVEFFILRPNLDIYMEDVKNEPGQVAAESIMTTGVRVGVFFVLAVVTTGMFG